MERAFKKISLVILTITMGAINISCTTTNSDTSYPVNQCKVSGVKNIDKISAYYLSCQVLIDRGHPLEFEMIKSNNNKHEIMTAEQMFLIKKSKFPTAIVSTSAITAASLGSQGGGSASENIAIAALVVGMSIAEDYKPNHQPNNKQSLYMEGVYDLDQSQATITAPKPSALRTTKSGMLIIKSAVPEPPQSLTICIKNPNRICFEAPVTDPNARRRRIPLSYQGSGNGSPAEAIIWGI